MFIPHRPTTDAWHWVSLVSRVSEQHLCAEQSFAWQSFSKNIVYCQKRTAKSSESSFSAPNISESLESDSGQTTRRGRPPVKSAQSRLFALPSPRGWTRSTCHRKILLLFLGTRHTPHASKRRIVPVRTGTVRIQSALRKRLGRISALGSNTKHRGKEKRGQKTWKKNKTKQ